MKKILLLFSIMVFLSFSVYADDSMIKDRIDTRGLDLTVVNEVPKGITPIVINSQKDFDNFVSNINNIDYVLEKDVIGLKKDILSLDKTINSAGKYKVIQVKKSKGIGVNFAGHYAGRIVLRGDVTIFTTHYSPYSTRGLYSEITNASGYTSLEGFTYSFDWEDKGVTTRISRDKQSVDFYGHGTLKYYFLIDGLINVYNENVDISHTYNL